MRALLGSSKAAPSSLLARLRAASAAFSTAEASTAVQSSSSSSSNSSSRAVEGLADGSVSRAAAAGHPAFLATGGSTRSSSSGTAAAEGIVGPPDSSSSSGSGGSASGGSASGSGGRHKSDAEILQAVLEDASGIWHGLRSLRLKDLLVAIDQSSGGPVPGDAALSEGERRGQLHRRQCWLSGALQRANSSRRIAQLLLGQRHALESVHLEQALARLGQLVRQERRVPSEQEQEVFLGARELLFGLLDQEGRQLSTGAACHLLCASAWVRLPLAPEQQEAVEKVVVPEMDRLSAKHTQEMLSSYLRLGMRPGPEVAAWLTPALCRQSGAARRPTAAPGQQGQQRLLLSAELLSKELTRAARLGQHTNLLRLLLHHADALNSVHLFISLEALAQVRLRGDAPAAAVWGHSRSRQQQQQQQQQQQGRAQQLLPQHEETDVAAAEQGETEWRAEVDSDGQALLRKRQRRRQSQPVLIDTFRTLREVAVEAVLLEGLHSEAAMSAARSLLHTSAAVGVPLGGADQAAVEAVTLRGLSEASCADLAVLATAYAKLAMAPSSSLQQAAVVAAERVLGAASPRELHAILPAWQRCGWPVTPAMVSAAELAALCCLHNAIEGAAAAAATAAGHASHPRSATTAAATADGGGGTSTPWRPPTWGGAGSHAHAGTAADAHHAAPPHHSAQGVHSLRGMARLAVRLLEAFALAEWPLGPALATDLQRTLPLCVPAADLAMASRLLACSLRLGLLPDPQLAAVFLRLAAQELPAAVAAGAPTAAAAGLQQGAAAAGLQQGAAAAAAAGLQQGAAAADFSLRLLTALKLQGWRLEGAPEEERRAVQLTLGSLEQWLCGLQAGRRRRSFLEIRQDVQQLVRWLHLLSALGVQPPDHVLTASCVYLRQHRRVLWKKERQRLQEAFACWAYEAHGLHGVLELADGGSASYAEEGAEREAVSELAAHAGGGTAAAAAAAVEAAASGAAGAFG